MFSRILNLNVRLRRGITLAALAALIAAFCFGQVKRTDSAAAPKQAKRVIVISLDGLDVRYLVKRDEYKLKIPTLRRLMAEGAAARGVTTVYPSVTYPAHTTIATGVLPARHGIVGNDIFEPPEAPQTGEWNFFARDIKVDTLWDAAERKGLTTAMISWPVSAGAGDYNFPEIFKGAATSNETLAATSNETLKAIKDNARPRGFVDEMEKRDPTLYRNVNADEADDLRTRFAEYVISEKRPDLVLVHLFDFDHFQHDFGPFTPEAFAMLEKVDGYLARILAAAERAGTLGESAVFIVSDHGFKPITKQVHPGVLLAKAGLIKVKEQNDAGGKVRAVVTDWRALPYPTSGSCSIILRDPRDKEALKKALEVFKPLERRMGGGIFRVVEMKELRKLGANPRAALMLDAENGHTFGNNFTGPFITDTTRRGQHGYLPTRTDYKTSFIVSGAGVARRGDLGDVRMIDIGPTIASVLNLKLRDAEGRALKLK